jgi:hypothetical protein
VVGLPPPQRPRRQAAEDQLIDTPEQGAGDESAVEIRQNCARDGFVVQTTPRMPPGMMSSSRARPAATASNAASPASIPDLIAACEPLMRGAFRKPASPAASAPPGNASFGSDCRPLALIARAP